MDYMEKIDKLLEENLSENSLDLWRVLKEKIPDIWQKPSSSSGKYHRKENGIVPSIAEHTFEVLTAAIKLLSIFNVFPRTSDGDILIFSVVLHDSFKYGDKNPITALHTYSKHDQLAADKICKNKNILMRIFNEDQINLLEKCLRYHSGRWSTGTDGDFSFSKLPPQTLFLHLLDMMSTHNLIYTGTRE